MGWADADDYTPRHIQDAIDRRDLVEVRRLFTEYPEFLRSSDGLDTWLWAAAHRGDLPLVQLLVELGLSVNEPNDKEMPEGPLDMAATRGHFEIVRWLLDSGATINHVFRGRRRCMPLMGAAMRGHLDVVKLLVERGADIHSSWHCMNALMHAKGHGQQAVVEYLRSLGVKDLRETIPPNYPAAHKLIVEHMTEQRASLSDWKVEIPGDPMVTICRVPGNEQDQEQMLFTVGLSDRRLATAWEEFACGELKLTLSPHWPFSESALADPRWNWPVEWLKRIVMDLRQRDRWPAEPVLFPNGGPVPFFPGTKLCCWLCLRSQGGSIQIPDCRWVDFHGLFPIYAEEMQLVRKRGHEPLVARFQSRDLPTYVDPDRPNVAWDPEPSE